MFVYFACVRVFIDHFSSVRKSLLGSTTSSGRIDDPQSHADHLSWQSTRPRMGRPGSSTAAGVRTRTLAAPSADSGSVAVRRSSVCDSLQYNKCTQV